MKSEREVSCHHSNFHLKFLDTQQFSLIIKALQTCFVPHSFFITFFFRIHLTSWRCQLNYDEATNWYLIIFQEPIEATSRQKCQEKSLTLFINFPCCVRSKKSKKRGLKFQSRRQETQWKSFPLKAKKNLLLIASKDAVSWDSLLIWCRINFWWLYNEDFSLPWICTHFQVCYRYLSANWCNETKEREKNLIFAIFWACFFLLYMEIRRVEFFGHEINSQHSSLVSNDIDTSSSFSRFACCVICDNQRALVVGSTDRNTPVEWNED